MKKKHKWIDQIVDFISQLKDSTIVKSDVAPWILHHLYHTCPQQFVQIALKKGLHVQQQMSAIKAAAIWTDANVSIKKAQIILHHLYFKFKIRIHVPLVSMSELSSITKSISPTFDEFMYRKKGDSCSKVTEHV